MTIVLKSSHKKSSSYYKTELQKLSVNYFISKRLKPKRLARIKKVEVPKLIIYHNITKLEIK